MADRNLRQRTEKEQQQMKTLPLLFDPKESLQILQYQNPDFWEVDIVNQRLDILTQVNSYKISHSKALGNCIRDCKTMAERILVMAAYQNIMDQKAVHYQNACEQIARIRIQQKALETNRVISDADKQVIGEFYYERLFVLENVRREGLATPELCRHLQVRYDDSLTPKEQRS